MKSSREWVIEVRYTYEHFDAFVWYVAKINGTKMRPTTLTQAMARWSKDWKIRRGDWTILRFHNIATGEIIPEELLQ